MIKKLMSGVSILFLLNGLCLAAISVDLNDFKDTNWTLYGTVKATASRIGTKSASGLSYIDFNDDGSARINLDSDLTVTGNYFLDTKGNLVIEINQQEIQKYFEDFVAEAISEEDIGDYIDSWWVDIVSAKTATKVRYRDNVVSLATTILIKARLTISVETDNGSREFHSGMSFTIKLTGDHLIKGAESWSSKWIINNAKIKARVGKVNASTPVNFELTLGDYGALVATDNNFEMVDVNFMLLISEDMAGNFCRIKNKVFLWADDPDYINKLIESQISYQYNVSGFWVNDYTGVLTATINKQKITLSGTIHFNAGIAYSQGGEADNVKGTLTLKGKGVRVP